MHPSESLVDVIAHHPDGSGSLLFLGDKGGLYKVAIGPAGEAKFELVAESENRLTAS